MKDSDKGLEFDFFHSVNSPTLLEEKALVDFLFEHLENYGDPKTHIHKAIEYACSHHKGKGGFVLVAKKNEAIAGIVVMNKTGMGDYIPENILVYIAVNSNYRGQGIGKSLMERALDLANGDVALHVEPDNPAKRLYEKIGFTSKYLEMRYAKG